MSYPYNTLKLEAQMLTCENRQYYAASPRADEYHPKVLAYLRPQYESLGLIVLNCSKDDDEGGVRRRFPVAGGLLGMATYERGSAEAGETVGSEAV